VMVIVTVPPTGTLEGVTLIGGAAHAGAIPKSKTAEANSVATFQALNMGV
jgi:hypothetical protein